MRRLFLATLAAAAFAWPFAAPAAEDFSPAERALFMSPQLANVKPPATLRYRFTKAGSLEAGFSDDVVMKLKAGANQRCCDAAVEFLTGPRKLVLPEVEALEGNPVVLYFLERDIREMNRLTKGQAAYFRKRIRMAVYQGAQITELQLPYAGRTVAARQIVVAPYLDDPLRTRFEQLAGKRYRFTLSDAVPGGVYALGSEVDGPAPDSPVLQETLVLEGAAPPPRRP
jgi:hypothetical protein